MLYIRFLATLSNICVGIDIYRIKSYLLIIFTKEVTVLFGLLFVCLFVQLSCG